MSVLYMEGMKVLRWECSWEYKKGFHLGLQSVVAKVQQWVYSLE